MPCSIIPPYILRSIAERGDAEQRERARAALERSSQTRGERIVVEELGAMLAVSPGEKRRTLYDAKRTTLLPGKLVRAEGSAPSGDAAVDEAYDGAGKTYDFFRAVLGRNSIDDRGMRLDATVHYDVDYDNAEWNGRQMIYGDGDGKLFRRFTSCVDVIAHELSHGVTQYSAKLVYSGQSGALNEHFSDVFGILVKQYALKQTAKKSDWLIGAGLFTPRVHGVAVRSMKAPGTAYDDPVVGKDPQPAHMDQYQRMRDDNGGVHVNNGIPNHAFYLAAIALGGKAWEVAGKIWYAALTRKLHARSTFRDCAAATIAAAGELFGRGGAAEGAVAQAWKAVGVT
jgi:Zn-dependent metalloprotease